MEKSIQEVVHVASDDAASGLGSALSKYWDKVKEFLGKQYRQHTTGVLKCGPVPRHIAFIMDGNRRFARKIHSETKVGHTLGGETLMDTLKWCLELGISTITVFAFSIENFKRSMDEVDTLMQIAHDKLGELLASPETKRYFQIRGIGDLTLLPPALQTRIKDIEEYTKHNTAGVFNVCFSYTATNEITSAIKKVVHEQLHPKPPAHSEAQDLHDHHGAEDGGLEIQESDIERCLSSFGSPDLDMLIRTSGEIRLSDFMLWQSTATCLVITDVLWPEFSAHHLYAAILYYQEHHDSLMAIRSTLAQQLDVPPKPSGPNVKVES